jgi:hypothetical protein
LAGPAGKSSAGAAAQSPKLAAVRMKERRFNPAVARDPSFSISSSLVGSVTCILPNRLATRITSSDKTLGDGSRAAA